MFSIGEFARHGRISVRMLRHYDAVGVLVPAMVDPVTGYRFYQAGQLSRLNRIIALKDLGFSLRQVHQILDEELSAAELRGMLKLRQAELAAQIEADTARMSRIEARLLAIEREENLPGDGIVVRPVPAVRVAELTGTAASYEPAAITPVIGPLYDDLFCRLARADLTAAGPAVAYYQAGRLGPGRARSSGGLPELASVLSGRDATLRALPGKGRVGMEMMASSAASRRRKAKANQVGIHRMLRQCRCFTASGRLMASGIAPPMAYRRKNVATFCR
jgi:DNA-binding transcriptional MerR regulator